MYILRLEFLLEQYGYISRFWLKWMHIYMLQVLYKFSWKTKKLNSCKMIFPSICGTRFWSNIFCMIHPVRTLTSILSPKNCPKLLQRNHNPFFVFLDLIYNIKWQYFYINAYKIRTFWFHFFYCSGKYIL